MAGGGLILMVGMIFGGLSRTGGWFPGIDLIHQGFMAVGGSVILAVYIIAYSHFTKNKILFWLSTITNISLLLQAVLGQSLYWGWGIAQSVGLHYTLSIVILSTTTASVGFIFLSKQPIAEQTLHFRTSFSRRSIWLIGLVLLVLVSGVWLAESGEQRACEGWPLCNQSVIPMGAALLTAVRINRCVRCFFQDSSAYWNK